MYKLRDVSPAKAAGGKAGKLPHVHLLGSGAILREVIRGGELLAEHWGVSSTVWSVTSWKELRRAAQECLDGDARLGRYIELGGTEALEYDQILDIIGSAMGKPKVRKIHAPMGIVKLQAKLLQVLPNPPVTPAAVELLEHDNVAASLDVVEKEFGFTPVGFAEHIASHGLER